MISNIISLPFRVATSQPLSTAIRQYISSKYNQHPYMFKEDFEEIDALRESAVQVLEPHVSGVKKITAYAAQLVWISGKFPIDLGVDFKWYPALGYSKDKPIALNNLKFELASVLYNLAALYSQLAISSNRSTTEGLKLVCNYFCLAAGVIRHVQEKIIPEMQKAPPIDLDDSTLECIQHLLHAQAQECFWRKAVIDRYRDSSVAKLAAMTSDLYGIAADWGTKSEVISSEWIHFATAKHHHFAAAAQFRQACDCLEKKKYGEEVARLRESISSAKEGLKEAKYLNKLVYEDLNSLKNKVAEDLNRAERDNDMIYLCPVPPKTELKNLERAVMIIAKTPLEVSEPLSFLGEKEDFGPPLFAKLVPFAVHVATSIFEQRLDRMVNKSIILPLENLTIEIHSTLSSLSLPGSLQAIEKPLGLPSTLASHAEEIRQSDAIARIRRSFSDTAGLAQLAASKFDEASSYIIAERTENERLKAKYGTDRWTRLDSASAAPKLYKKLNEIDDYLKTAAKSDLLIHEKFQGCKDLLYILSSGDGEISHFVPNARRVAMSSKLEEQVFKLRSCLNEVTRLESRRRKKIESLLESAKKDDINPAILDEATRLESIYPAQSLVPAHFEEFLEQRLSVYDSHIIELESEEKEQNQLLRKLENLHREFIKAKSEDDSSFKDREIVLQSLEDAYFQYKEIVSNLEAGRKFYNDLGQMVEKFKDEIKIWTSKRGDEAVIFERDLKLGSNPSGFVAHTQPQQQQQQSQNDTTSKILHIQPHLKFPSQSAQTISINPKISEFSTSHTQQHSPVEPVLNIWNPNMEIKFVSSEANKIDRKDSVRTKNRTDHDVIFSKKDSKGNKISSEYRGREASIDGPGTLNSNTDEIGKNHTWDPQNSLRFG
ncbi:pH-response regulator protein palA/RIM20 [Golovinomyces cichoracearum]|uniref:pH-response regulator protein palA/RIM20 n=1 Tax=Golovinomyces cichoracearum TaxID=62708 RepID=A0A420HET2_9PEZI|nr:pH-response regulator protein palA/RIM20 [Golovinomyces cichoracearum]